MTGLEACYRRLLRLYPKPHREEYGEEMIGVLMADGRPGAGQVVDLVRSAFAARVRGGLRLAGREMADASWGQAAGVIQLFGAILLASVGVRRMLLDVIGAVVHNGPIPRLDRAHWDLAYLSVPGVWLGVVLCALAAYALPRRGSNLLRAIAVGLSALGLVQEIVPRATYYADSPVAFLNVYWIIVAAALVLLASAVVLSGAATRRTPTAEAESGRSRSPSSALPSNGLPGGGMSTDAVPRGVVLAGLAGLAILISGWDTVLFDPYGRTTVLLPGGRYLSAWSVASLAVALLLLVGGVLRLPPPVRRRVISGAVPVLVTIPLVRFGLGAFLEHNLRHPEAVRGLDLLQWSGLILIPLAAFVVTADLNRRLEASRRAAARPRPARPHPVRPDTSRTDAN